MTSTVPLLGIEHLIVGPRSEGAPILHGVSLGLNTGDFLAVVGESGSGKTTLAHAVMGLLPEQLAVKSGRILLGGVDLPGLSERAHARLRGKDIGFVPQDPGTSLNPVKTIGAQLAEIFSLHGEGGGRSGIRERSIALLEEVGIDRPAERLKQYPHHLSGGMRQRVLLAIGFALGPRLLIADEPTSALDVTVQKQAMKVFRRLVRDHGTSVIFVTHDIALAAEHASHLLVMRGGRVVESGTADDLLRRPQEAYTRTLLASALPGAPRTRAPTRRAEQPIISVAGLTKHFSARRSFLARRPPAFAAVSDVSFDIPEGSTFALVGESGSGKSTTARMIIGLERPTAGQVRFGGADIAGAGLAARREIWKHIQLVHQNPFSSLNPRHTVAGIVSSPLVAHRQGTPATRRRRVEQLLEQVGLAPELADRRPHALSGGQRQRVAIARALALEARVIVLDEALSALDAVTQDHISRLLRTLQDRQGLTYLMISHDLTMVRHFADSVGVMRAGQLVEAGPTADIFERPSSPYTRALLDALPSEALRLRLASGASVSAA